MSLRSVARLSLVLALVALLSSSILRAQITNVTADQAPPKPGVGHDYIGLLNETVNPATGSVSIRIGVPTPPGREFTQPFAFTYDSNSAFHRIGAGTFTDNLGWLAKGGWTYQVPNLVFQTHQVLWQSLGNNWPYTCNFWNSFVFTDLHGETHSLAMAAFQANNSQNCVWPAGSPPSDILSGGDTYVQSTATAHAPLPITVADADGTVYYFSGSPTTSCTGAGYTGNVPDWIETRNGNKIVFSGTCAAPSFTDTANRSVIAMNGFGASGNTVTASGLGAYTVTWGTANFNTSYAFTATEQQGLGYTCGGGTPTYSQPEISAIALPNGKSYQFQYDPSTGLVSKIIYPTGGYIRYVWGVNHSSEILEFYPDSNQNPTCAMVYDTPALLQRYVSYDGTTEVQRQDFSNYTTTWVPDSQCSNCQKWTTKTVNVTTNDLLRGTASETDYSYSPMGIPNSPWDASYHVVNYALQWGVVQPHYFPVEQTVTQKSNTGSVLKTFTKGWNGSHLLGCQLETLDNGAISGAFYSYGAGGVVTDKKEYAYGQITSTTACQNFLSPPTTTPLRETITSYQTFGTTPIFPSGPSILDRPCSTITYGNGVRIAESDYFYDGSTSTTPCSSSVTQTLPGTGSYSGHDETLYGPGASVARGNTTKVIHKCLQSCSDTTTTYTYDETGQVATSTDACGNTACSDVTGTNHTTTYSHADNFDSNPASQTNAYLTQITDPVGHISKFKYAYSDGQVVSSTDQNNLSTSYVYADSLRRLTETDLPDGGQTTVAYNDLAPSPTVTATKKINSTQSVTTVTKRDGVGHTVQTKLCEDGSACGQPILTDATFDGLGRAWKVSNPYRSTSDATYGITTTTFDALGRTTLVVPPDGTSYSKNVSTQYSGNCTVVTDQTLRARKSCVDSFGRVIEVDEPSAPLSNSFATPGQGSATASGTERTTTTGTNSTGSVTFNLYSGQVFSSGTLSLKVNGVVVGSTPYSSGEPGSPMATSLANSVNGNGSSPVIASASSCCGGLGPGTVNLTSKTTGSATNYSLAISCSSACPPSTGTSGSTMTGGTGPTTVYDTGTVSVSVNGVNSSVTYGQTSTSASVASALVTAINGNSNSVVTATLSGSVINLTSKLGGASTNYSLSCSSSTNQPTLFSGTSFPLSCSGSALTGGVDGVATPFNFPGPYTTLYTYDVLGNLTCAVQRGTDTTAFSTCAAAPAVWRPRSFTYDSLSRMLTSTNPEVGTLTYTYDANSNVSTKKDARNITTTYGYDVLNRSLSISYSNGDPGVAIVYDQANCLGLSACQNVGQRTSMTDAAGSEAWAYQVDATNKRNIHVNQRTTGGITKNSTYYLDLTADLTQVVYPTGRTVNFTYDNAGRPATATDSANGITYASGTCGSAGTAVCYAPQGALTSAKLGVSSVFPGGLVLTNSYNNRLQPNELKASSSGGNAFDISYNFVDSTSQGNAGHVYGITNNIDSTRSQLFTYDPLNRIASAKTTSTHATSAAHCWGEIYTTDPWANLQTIAPTTDPAYTGCTQESGFTKTPDNGNHLSGFGYDLAGNTSSDGSFTYTWDGESQLKTAGGVTYTYDGNGRRVSKSNGKYYWYGSGGEILAETTATGAVTNEYIFFGGKRIALLPAGGTAQFYAEDLLGSSRVVTTNTGVVCYDADFYPFGGERTPYTNTCTQNAYKFEGKERDAETSNDDFGARYYSNRFGRWLSADWSNVPVAVPYANLTNPQTLNLYAMVSDDPETFADLDGHLPCFDVGGGGLCNANGHESPPPDQQQAQAAQIKYYDVQGATASEAMANANKSAHGGCSTPSAGCTHADFVEAPTTKVTSEKTSSGMSVTGTVVDVKVTVSITTTLPNWTGYAGASASEQKAWDTSLAALKTHEDGHAAINRAGVKEMKSAVLGTTATASGASYQQAQSKMFTKLADNVATKFQAAIAANQKRNDDYDLANK